MFVLTFNLKILKKKKKKIKLCECSSLAIWKYNDKETILNSLKKK